MTLNGEIDEVAETVVAIVRAGIPVARYAMIATVLNDKAEEIDRLTAALYLLTGVEKGYWPLPREVEWAQFKNGTRP
jgi:hypothetical protein